jgi:hypothetical protein
MFNKEKVSPEFVKKFSDKLREIKQTQWFADLLDKHGHVEFGREN